MLKFRVRDDRTVTGAAYAHEESPNTEGQNAGEIPVKATSRKVQQK